MVDQPNYYSIIPANVRYDEKLKPNEKLLYGEITALANKNGYCWAENHYFANLYDVTKTTVSRWISNLENQGYVKTKLIYRDRSKQVSKRHIYITDPLLTKKSIPPIQNNQYPIDEKRKEELNTTSTNTTSINKDHSPAKAEHAPYKSIIGYLNQKTGKRYSHTANKNKDLIKARWNEGFREEDFKKVIDKKTEEWLGDEKMKQYLRPVTLFSNKFDEYLNQSPQKSTEGSWEEWNFMD